jgi:hypothetical protein
MHLSWKRCTGMLRQLGLEPPTAIMRLAARRSARRYRRELAATR